MFPEELPAKRGCELGCSVRLAIHVRFYGSWVFYDDCNLRIVIAELRTIIQIGGATDDYSIIGNQYLGRVS